MISVFVIIIGAVVGSFLNVCIYRIPRNESILWPPSRCPKCGKKIKFYDNIPIISYIILRGKCRYCKAKISIQYPVVEALTAFLFLFIYWRFGMNFTMLKYWIFSASLICISGIDFHHRVIPDIVVFPSLIAGVVFSILLKDISLFSLMGGTIGGALFLFIVRFIGSKILKREAMGEGDIILIAMIGAYTGLFGVYLSILIGSLVGSIVGVFLLLKNKREIPFGPFLSLGAIIAVFL